MESNDIMTLNEVIASAQSLGPDKQSELHLNCQGQGRHDLNASEDQLEKLPLLEGGPSDTWRYCPECWSVFDADGNLMSVVPAD